jgi:hypothetical protein
MLKQVTPAADRMSQAQERVLIENAVKPISDLAIVRTQAQTLQTATGTTIDTAGYIRLLLAAAINHDDSVKNTPRPPRRAVHHHEVDHYSPDDGEVYEVNTTDVTDDINYDIDTPVDVIVNAAEQRRRTPNRAPGSSGSGQNNPGFLPSERFKQLSEEGRTHWVKIPPSDRAIIFGLRSQYSSTNPRNDNNNRRNANLHEISAFEFG